MALAEKMGALFESESLFVVSAALRAHMLELSEQMKEMRGHDQDMDRAIDAISKTCAEMSLRISADDAVKLDS